MTTPKIKICGITKEREIDILNASDVDYCGFVFFEKSRRNVSITDAVKLKKKLHSGIQTVAVTVSPTIEMVEEVKNAGFQIIQIHGELKEEVTGFIDKSGMELWRAVNCEKLDELKGITGEREHLIGEGNLIGKGIPTGREIGGLVIDGASYGGGKTFDWNSFANEQECYKNLCEKSGERLFILAGGLNSQNVREGIRIFHPDVVDVSSGVEGTEGKSEEKIKEFIRKVREEDEQ